MRLIDGLEDKFSILVGRIRSVASGTFEFTTHDLSVAYAREYRKDFDFLEDRRRRIPRAHGLEGYLGGMFAGYCRKESKRSHKVEVERVGLNRYRLLP
jgi:hypothetical protein